MSVAIEGQAYVTELIDRRLEGRVCLGIGLVVFIKRVRLTRGGCGERCEGENACDKGCEAHDDDDERVVERQGKVNNELQGLNTLSCELMAHPSLPPRHSRGTSGRVYTHPPSLPPILVRELPKEEAQ